MFKITLSNADLLKNSIPIIAEIIDEGVFKVDAKGMSLVSPDRSMIAMVDFHLLSTAFEDFKVTGENLLGLNLANLVAVIKRVKTGDKVVLTKEDASNTLQVMIKGAGGSRKFEIPLLNITSEKPPLDQLKFTGKIEVDSGILEEGITDADIVDDSVVFETDHHCFKIWAKGDINSSEFEIKKGETGLDKIEVTEPIRARYPLEYLKKMIKAAKFSDKVMVEFANDYPLKMVFRDIDKIHLSFVLAPRVEE